MATTNNDLATIQAVVDKAKKLNEPNDNDETLDTSAGALVPSSNTSDYVSTLRDILNQSKTNRTISDLGANVGQVGDRLLSSVSRIAPNTEMYQNQRAQAEQDVQAAQKQLDSGQQMAIKASNMQPAGITVEGGRRNGAALYKNGLGQTMYVDPSSGKMIPYEPEANEIPRRQAPAPSPEMMLLSSIIAQQNVKKEGLAEEKDKRVDSKTLGEFQENLGLLTNLSQTEQYSKALGDKPAGYERFSKIAPALSSLGRLGASAIGQNPSSVPQIDPNALALRNSIFMGGAEQAKSALKRVNQTEFNQSMENSPGLSSTVEARQAFIDTIRARAIQNAKIIIQVEKDAGKDTSNMEATLQKYINTPAPVPKFTNTTTPSPTAAGAPAKMYTKEELTAMTPDQRKVILDQLRAAKGVQ